MSSSSPVQWAGRRNFLSWGLFGVTEEEASRPTELVLYYAYHLNFSSKFVIMHSQKDQMRTSYMKHWIRKSSSQLAYICMASWQVEEPKSIS